MGEARDNRITLEEIREMFGETMPIEVAQILWCGLFDPATARQKLRALAPSPSGKPATGEALFDLAKKWVDRVLDLHAEHSHLVDSPVMASISASS